MCMRRMVGCFVVLLLSVVQAGAASSQVADAVTQGRKDLLRSLLQQKADVNAPQVDGTTALHWAVLADDLEAADLLLRAGARISAVNREGATPLQLAALNGSAGMLERLVKAGADPNAPLSAYGDTALMMIDSHTQIRTHRVTPRTRSG